MFGRSYFNNKFVRIFLYSCFIIVFLIFSIILSSRLGFLSKLVSFLESRSASVFCVGLSLYPFRIVFFKILIFFFYVTFVLDFIYDKIFLNFLKKGITLRLNKKWQRRLLLLFCLHYLLISLI